jgi:3-deoxy-D-manno-octulosonate 8-phosphate phosphatase (KDO 8-P phosphatase)
MIPLVVIQKIPDIRLIALDVDGVLTRGDIMYTQDGGEIKVFNVKDGHGLSVLRHQGFQVALVTGRQSPITQRRADELGITHVFQGVRQKLPVLQSLVDALGISLDAVLYMGDDTPDIPVMEAVGLAICPSDAVTAVRNISHYVTPQPGGCGAVRQVVDLLLAHHPVLKTTPKPEHLISC